VGWEPPERIEWPVKDDVLKAARNADGVSLLSWHRFLPAADTDERREVVDLIAVALKINRK